MNFFYYNKTDLINRKKNWSRIFRITKLSCLLLLTVLVQISATAYSQATKFDMQMENTTVKEVFKAIEDQSEFRFFYSDDLSFINKKITVDVNNATVESILDRILDHSDLTYHIFENNLIVVTPKGTFQQGIAITGTVTDATGEPLPGVSILIKGALQGTSTDANGAFSLQVPNENTILVFSFIGFVSQEIVVGNRRTINTTLADDTRQLEEVVVVGYGTIKKVNLTGAVDVVGSSVFEGRTVSNTTQALQGVVPNLNINMADGKIQGTASYNVRGLTSIGQGGSALVLIDGVEGDPSYLNPNDIESVSVLKDAASAAVYGSRATFGVVLITTKSPQKGKTTVNYTGNLSRMSLAKKQEFVYDGFTWLEHFRLAWWNQNGSVSANINGLQNYSDEWFERMREWKASGAGPKTEILPNGDYEYYCSTDWESMLWKDHSLVQDHNVTISGGNEKGDFYISGRFFDTDGMYNWDADVYNSYNLRVKGSLVAFKWLRITNNAEFSKTFGHISYNPVARGNGFQTYLNHVSYPTTPMYNPDGSFTRNGAWTLGALIDGNNYQNDRNTLFRNTVGFNTNFFNNTFRIIGDYSFRINSRDLFFKRVKLPFYTNAYATEPSYLGDINGVIYESQGNTMYTVSNIYAEYENTYAQKHYFKAMAGWNYETSTYKALNIQRNGLLLESAESVQLATGSSITPGASYTKWRTAGVFFRLNYGYQDRYLIEVNGRYDGSSRFPTAQQWGFFPSISGGWRLTEEPFWSVNKDLFSNIKIRASYGSLGNGNISPYSFAELLTIGTSGRVLNGGLNKSTSAPNPIPDGLTWERATTTDIGLDVDMLKGRILLGGDYYIRKTTDMYVAGPTLPQLFGATAPRGNYADMTTRGFELSLTWQDKIKVANKPFSYSIRGTLHDYKTTIDKFNNPTKLFTDHYVGKTYGELWGFQVDGLFQSDPLPGEYINTIFTPSTDGQWHAGDMKIRNRDNSPDNMITRGAQTVDNPGDMTIIGNTEPRYQYSFTLNANWNGFFMSAFFLGVGKKNWYPGSESVFWGQYMRAYNQMPAWHLGNYWTEDNRDAYLPRYKGGQDPTTYTYTANDRYMQNVSYLLLKNFQIGYTLPDTWVSRISIKSARIYMSGENIASWSPFYKVVGKHFMDVLSAQYTSDFTTGGGVGAGNAYPTLKTVSLGISVNF